MVSAQAIWLRLGSNGFFACNLATYTIAASSLSSLLWRHVYPLCPRAILQAGKTWSRVCLFEHSGHAPSSVFPYFTSSAADGRRSYIERISKVSRKGVIFRTSHHVRDLCGALSWPFPRTCCACCADFWTIFSSSVSRIPCTTISLGSQTDVCDHHPPSFLSKPCLCDWVYPMTSFSINASWATSTALVTFHFLPVLRLGRDFRTIGSTDSSSIIISRALQDL